MMSGVIEFKCNYGCQVCIVSIVGFVGWSRTRDGVVVAVGGTKGRESGKNGSECRGGGVEGGQAGAAEERVPQSPTLLQPRSRATEMMPRRTVKTQQTLSSVCKTIRPRVLTRCDGAHSGGHCRLVSQICAPLLRGLKERHTKSPVGGG